MVVDLSTVVEALGGLAMASITAAIPIVVPAVLRSLHINADQAMVQAIAAATQRAAGQVALAVSAHKDSFAHVEIHDAALAAATQNVVAKFPEYTRALGVTPETVRDMVQGELGKMAAASGQAVIPPIGPKNPSP